MFTININNSSDWSSSFSGIFGSKCFSINFWDCS